MDYKGYLRVVNDKARQLLPMVPNPEGRLAENTVPVPRLLEVLAIEDESSIDENLHIGSKVLKIRSV